MKDFKELRESTQVTLLNRIFDEVIKVPPAVLRLLKDQSAFHGGYHIDLVLGNVTRHYLSSGLKRKTPRGWTSGTWGKADGSSANGYVVIAADSKRGFDTTLPSVLLHELGHSYDRSYPKSRGWGEKARLSKSREFMTAFYGTRFTNEDRNYVGLFPIECFAESFSRYYFSQETRTWLKNTYPLIYQFFERYLPSPVT
jgi:hypothetical protein